MSETHTSAHSIHDRLMRGEIVAVGNKLYARCGQCYDVVQINKWLIGSLHQCCSDFESLCRHNEVTP